MSKEPPLKKLRLSFLLNDASEERNGSELADYPAPVGNEAGTPLQKPLLLRNSAGPSIKCPYCSKRYSSAGNCNKHVGCFRNFFCVCQESIYLPIKCHFLLLGPVDSFEISASRVQALGEKSFFSLKV